MTCLGRRRRAVERVLEDESLTADLIDPAARILLQWGVARAQVIGREEGQEDLNARLDALRSTMRRIGRQAGEAAPEAQVEAVESLLAETERGEGRERDKGDEGSGEESAPGG